MEFDEYDYLEKTVENPEQPKVRETANGEGDIVKSREKDRLRSSKRRSDDKDDGDDERRRSKQSRSGDENKDHEQSKERGLSHHRSQSRDGERDRHRSSREHRDRDRGKDRDREERNGKERDRDRDRREHDRDGEREREREKEKERERSRRSRSRSERHRSDQDEKEREREREKERTGSIQMAFKGAEPIPEETTSNSLLTNTRCCFCFPCFSSRRSSTVGLSFWERIQSSSQSHGYDPHQNQWWFKGIRALKKIREWSEIVAGPKWKTFIRRFNRTKSSGSGSGRRHGNFQYDPLSYSLNFDEGPGGQKGDFDELDDYGGFRDFSSRYASVSASGQPVDMDASESKDVVVMA